MVVGGIIKVSVISRWQRLVPHASGLDFGLLAGATIQVFATSREARLHVASRLAAEASIVLAAKSPKARLAAHGTITGSLCLQPGGWAPRG